MNFDPDLYTIMIRKERIDGEDYFVGRVAEFPNVSAFENTQQECLSVIRTALVSIAERAHQLGNKLPEPLQSPVEEASGRSRKSSLDIPPAAAA